MTYKRDQKLIYIGKDKSKPPIVTLDGDPEDYLIRLKCVKTGRVVWCHSALMKVNWSEPKRAKKKALGSEKLTGKQDELFPMPKTVREQWREQTLNK